MTPTAIRPESFPWFDYSRYSFSLGLSLGPDRATLSGHSASEYDPDRSRIVVNGDMACQTRTAYRKIERILGAAGLGLEDVVRVVENVTVAGMDHYAQAETVDADGSHLSKPRTVLGIGLGGNLRTGRDSRHRSGGVKDSTQRVRRNLRRRTAAEIDRVERRAAAHLREPGLHLADHRRRVPFRQVRLAHVEREVAVGTPGFAERDVDV